MKTIKSFLLTVEPVQSLDIAFGSETIDFSVRNGCPTLSVLIDGAYAKTIRRVFHTFVEGKEIPPRFNKTNHLGSFDCDGHTLHVFEE